MHVSLTHRVMGGRGVLPLLLLLTVAAQGSKPYDDFHYPAEEPDERERHGSPPRLLKVFNSTSIELALGEEMANVSVPGLWQSWHVVHVLTSPRVMVVMASCILT